MTDSISSLSQTIPILKVDSTLSKGLMILEDLSASKKQKVSLNYQKIWSLPNPIPLDYCKL
jgi:hypothetical protein